MSTLTLGLFITNLILIFLCLLLVYPKVIQHYKEKKKLRETKAKQGRALEKAHFVKAIRTEVRKYLEELRNDNQ